MVIHDGVYERRAQAGAVVAVAQAGAVGGGLPVAVALGPAEVAP